MRSIRRICAIERAPYTGDAARRAMQYAKAVTNDKLRTLGRAEEHAAMKESI